MSRPEDLIFQHPAGADVAHHEIRMVESEETETWQGMHGRNITAPKGTFEKIFNDNDTEDDGV